MSKLTIIFITIIVLFGGYALFTLRATDEIGSFDVIRASGEINQSVHVLIDGSMGFERDGLNNIIGFYVKDIKNSQAKVSLDEPAPAEIVDAEVVELLGHMHGDNFVAKRVSIVRTSEEDSK